MLNALAAPVTFLCGDTPISLEVFEDSDHISKLIRTNRQFYEADVLDKIALFDFAETTAIDAGANIGNHTVFFAKVLGLQTLAVEPDPDAFAILGRNLQINAIEDRTEAVPAALWSCRTRGKLTHATADNHGQVRFVEAPDGDIATTTIDILAQGKAVALVKIDVEGAELEVLKGGLDTIVRCRPLLVVECIGLGDRQAVDALLTPLGYRRIGRAGATPTYFYAPPETALNVAVANGFDASGALYQLNPRSYLAAVERKERKDAGARLVRSQAEVARVEEHNRLLRAEIDALRSGLDRARVEKIRLTLRNELLERKLEHQTFRKDLIDKKLRWLFTVRSRSLGARTRQLAWRLSGGRVPRLQTYSQFAGQLSRTSERKWRELQRKPQRLEALVAHDATIMRSAKVTVFMATYPAREQNLTEVVAALLPQCDVLHVYLNEYETVPDCLRSPNIRVTLGRDAAGDLKDNGKFHAVTDYPEGYHVFVDDDIVYPRDYVKRIVRGIEHFGYRAIVGFHGTIYREPLKSYIRDREVVPFFRSSQHVLVDQLGTGTVGYHTSTFCADPASFETTGIADLWFARDAARRGVPLVALKRPDKWLQGMMEVGDTLFRQVQRSDERQTALLNEHLAPALRQGARANLLGFLGSLHTPLRLEQAALDLDRSRSGCFGASPDQSRDIHFALIVTGWNCAAYVRACLASLERQIPAGYSFGIHAYDDGSDDETWSLLSKASERIRLNIFRGERNMGPAYARDFLIRQIEDPNAICVLVDMDDQLLPDALRTLEATYRTRPQCWMTYGNWINQNGVLNTEGLYTDDEIGRRAYRSSDKFKFTHLRSFRRFLYDKVDPAHLRDAEGEWLRFCSDVGLMLPIVDQCSPENVVAINQPLYVYNQYLAGGTQKRFGPKKNQTFRYLRDNRSLFRFPQQPPEET